MQKLFVFAVAVMAGGYAYQEYTGKSVTHALQSFSFGGAGGGFAGGYGMAVDSGGSIGQSIKGVAGSVGGALGSVGN